MKKYIKLILLVEYFPNGLTNYSDISSKINRTPATSDTTAQLWNSASNTNCHSVAENLPNYNLHDVTNEKVDTNISASS